jgi:hypothetical protein
MVLRRRWQADQYQRGIPLERLMPLSERPLCQAARGVNGATEEPVDGIGYIGILDVGDHGLITQNGGEKSRLSVVIVIMMLPANLLGGVTSAIAILAALLSRLRPLMNS